MLIYTSKFSGTYFIFIIFEAIYRREKYIEISLYLWHTKLVMEIKNKEEFRLRDN